MWLPYDDSKVDNWFTKETDYLLKTENDCVRLAGLFTTRHNYDDNGCSEYRWLTAELREIPRNVIKEYMVIPK